MGKHMTQKFTIGETRFKHIWEEQFNTIIQSEHFMYEIPLNNEDEKILIQEMQLNLKNRKYEIKFRAKFYYDLLSETEMFNEFFKAIIQEKTIQANFNVKDKNGFLRNIEYPPMIKFFEKIILERCCFYPKHALLYLTKIIQTYFDPKQSLLMKINSNQEVSTQRNE